MLVLITSNATFGLLLLLDIFIRSKITLPSHGLSHEGSKRRVFQSMKLIPSEDPFLKHALLYQYLKWRHIIQSQYNVPSKLGVKREQRTAMTIPLF